MPPKFQDAPVRTVVDIDCLPLFTLLAALDFPTVDFFSLDVEGAELGILQTIPWDKVNIVLTEKGSWEAFLYQNLGGRGGSKALLIMCKIIWAGIGDLPTYLPIYLQKTFSTIQSLTRACLTFPFQSMHIRVW